MLYLALSVLCSSLIFVIFKLFDVYKVQTLYAIITNYIVASTVGLLLYEGKVDFNEILDKPWIWGTMALGVFFIFVFNIMAKTSQVAGVSVASVATKMSLVMPVVFGVLWYSESLSFLQTVGILLALAAVYLASLKQGGINIPKKSLILPLLVFLGSGIIDISIQYFQENHLDEKEVAIFSSMVFGFAALSGLIFIGVQARKKPIRINLKNVMGGVALGVPNYFSIYFLIRALQNENLDSAVIFTLNNVAIVLFSTVLGILVFKERLSQKNWGGVALAVVSIILVALF